MILTGEEILRMAREGRITIDPLDERHVGPNSVDLTLGDELLVYEHATAWRRWVAAALGLVGWHWPAPLDSAAPPRSRRLPVPAGGLWLRPGILYLGVTCEEVGSDEFVPSLNGRSSGGRLGVQVHLTAGSGDLGYVGCWTLEMTVVHPVLVYPGMRIAQVSFSAARGDRSRQYKGKYGAEDARRPQPSRMWRDFRDRGEA